MALAGHVPLARQAESWFYDHTETGQVIVAARDAMKADGVPRPCGPTSCPAAEVAQGVSRTKCSTRLRPSCLAR